MTRELYGVQHWRIRSTKVPGYQADQALEALESISPYFKSKKQLAERIGISPGCVSDYFQGRSKPSQKTCERIFELARELGG